MKKKEETKVLEYFMENKKLQQNFKAFRRLKQTNFFWEGYDQTPTDTILEKMVKVFEEHTDAPLEIPFHVTFSHIAAFMVSNGIKINIAGKDFDPAIWKAILASSGSCKTIVADYIADIFSDAGIAKLTDFTSAAKFIDNLSEKKRSFYLKDEFGQLWKDIETAKGPMADLRSYLLQTSSGNAISRNTRSGEVTIENPVLVILGLSVDDTFLEQVKMESILDGFGQRFAYIRAIADENRPMWDFPLYTHETVDKKPFRDEVAKIVASIQPNSSLELSNEAIKIYKETFSGLAKSSTIPASFFRRIMFRACHYAGIYHVLLKKGNSPIDKDDMKWALSLVGREMQDTAWLLENHGISDIEKRCRKVEALKKKFDAQNKELTRRDVVRYVKEIRFASEAQMILDIVS